MTTNDVILAKLSVINNCLNTINTVASSTSEKLNDIIAQDVFVINLQRAIQAYIDIANNITKYDVIY